MEQKALSHRLSVAGHGLLVIRYRSSSPGHQVAGYRSLADGESPAVAAGSPNPLRRLTANGTASSKIVSAFTSTEV